MSAFKKIVHIVLNDMKVLHFVYNDCFIDMLIDDRSSVCTLCVNRLDELSSLFAQL